MHSTACEVHDMILTESFWCAVRTNRLCTILFTKPTFIGAFVSAPVNGIHPFFHIPMKGGIWPVGSAVGQIMLDRIEMNIIKMAVQVVSVSNQVFPKTTLPETGFSAFLL